MVGCLACALRWPQRASRGTQKMLTARYSSGSSGSAPSACSRSSWACLSSKASEMYLRKIRPRTTCLYSAASIEPRSASAMRHSSASYPVVAAWAVAAPPPSAFCFLGRPRAMTLVYITPVAPTDGARHTLPRMVWPSQ